MSSRRYDQCIHFEYVVPTPRLPSFGGLVMRELNFAPEMDIFITRSETVSYGIEIGGGYLITDLPLAVK
jgi:hypothetical protein